MRLQNLWIVAIMFSPLAAAEQPSSRPLLTETTAKLLLLRQKSVQEDMKLPPELVAKIMEFTGKQYEAWMAARKLGEAEREQKVKELREQNDKFLADNLSAEQSKRLNQIRLQVTGLYQLTRPEAAQALNLSEDQQQKFKALLAESGKSLEEIFTIKDREERHAKLAKLREDVDAKVESILTDEQKARARELVGAPFKGRILLEDAD